MNLTVEVQEALQKHFDNLATQQEMARKIQVQAEVFSNALVQERAFIPADEALAPFLEAWAPFGEPTISDSCRIVTSTYTPHYLLFEREVEPPKGECQDIFDAFLSLADENTYMNAKTAAHTRRFRVGKIVLELKIMCDVPSSYRDLLRAMGVIRTQAYDSYEALSCSFL